MTLFALLEKWDPFILSGFKGKNDFHSLQTNEKCLTKQRIYQNHYFHSPMHVSDIAIS